MTATRSGALSVHVPAAEPCDFFDGDLHDMFALFEGTEPLGMVAPRSPTDSSDSLGKDGPVNGASNSGTSSSAVVPSYGGQYPKTFDMAGVPTIMVPQQHLAAQGSFAFAQCDDGLLCGLESSAMYATGKGEGKLHISHSTIEKQRRDRINSLIDQLRDLVPSQGALRGPDGTEMKRPKHVVLSDTIRLLKRMQEQNVHDQHELQRLRSTLATASSGTQGIDTTGAAAGQPILELPVLLSNVPAAVGVVVEEGPQSFQVKVNCKDRHGLLSDITHALKDLPLEITRAAITTSTGGSVYDVFEIQYEPGCGITAMDVQYQLHSVLYAHRLREQEASLKRTRCDNP